MDTSKLETQPIHNEKQDEEIVVNQEKGANIEDQKLQSIDTSKSFCLWYSKLFIIFFRV